MPRFKHSAVDRNRLKRRLREISRLDVLPALSSVDVVVRARPEAYAVTYDALRAELQRVIARLAAPPAA